MQKQYFQPSLPFLSSEDNLPAKKSGVISNSNNFVNSDDRAFHNWYRFVLSFPPHLVRDYINDFGLNEQSTILDPFCGTGTTIVEAKLNQISAVGLEANPFPYFASTVKTDWNISPDELQSFAAQVSESSYTELANQGIDDRALTCESKVDLRTLDKQAMQAIIKNSISPLPLHKTLVLLEQINRYQSKSVHKYGVLALGNALVSSIGNLRFGPEVGVGKIKNDAPVVAVWMHEIRKMVSDLKSVYGKNYPETMVFLADAREPTKIIKENSIDAVITSPPYPNEKDYTRTTRLESVVLGFFEDMSQLQGFKKTLLRSNTRGVYKSDNDDRWVTDVEEVQRLAAAIEARRLELGKTSGFEKLYARVTKLYFGGMARHFSELTKILKPGAKLAYVVGDQASYLQVMIRTGQILAEIAEGLGYQVDRIDLFRTRFATATQNELREEVVVLKWPGSEPKQIYFARESSASYQFERTRNMVKYEEIVKWVFQQNYKPDMVRIPFNREELVKASEALGFERIKNLGDIPYSFRFRRELPDSIQVTAPEGAEWIIVGAGVGEYQFRLAAPGKIQPTPHLKPVKVPDATPEIVRHYAPGTDEQALLTRARYNRLVDIFTGITCYSIQNHLRTTVSNIGQVEVDEIYVGVNKRGTHFVLPCQAKSPGDRFGIVQVLQDVALCQERYPNAICKPIALQFMNDNRVAMLELAVTEENELLRLNIVDEKHYELVPRSQILDEDLRGLMESEL